jgi:hypothetical protein
MLTRGSCEGDTAMLAEACVVDVAWDVIPLYRQSGASGAWWWMCPRVENEDFGAALGAGRAAATEGYLSDAPTGPGVHKSGRSSHVLPIRSTGTMWKGARR